VRRTHPEDTYSFTVRPLHEVVTDSASRGLWVLLAATGLLLLIACTNVANLLLSRAVALERDLAIRASLGAARRHLIGHVTGETVALGLGAGVAGTALAWGLLRVFVALAPANFPRMAAIAIDLRVLGFSLAIAIVVALLTALVPAVHLLRSDLNHAVRAGGSRSATAGRARSASRALVVSEVALALALTATAGLMVKSLMRLHSQDLGWTREPVLTFSVGVPPFVANANDAIIRFHSEFLARIRAIPGVKYASAITLLPIVTTGTNGPVRRVDQAAEGDAVPVTEFRAVMDGYFDAMGVPLLAGRGIDVRDHAGTPSVAVLNDTVAKRLFPTLDAARMIGQPVRIGWMRGVTSEVIGVVKSVRSRRADAPPDPEVYVPYAHAASPTLSYVVRSHGNPSALVPSIRAALADLSPNVALAAVRTLDDIVSASTRQAGLLSWLSVLFGALAVVLAIVGIYSVMSYGVAQRQRELAIRAAIGATRTTLVSLVAREGLALSAIGICVGVGLALLASGVLRSLLFDVSATDPIVFAAAALALAAAAFAGYVLPAVRASRVNPVDALRGD
jgi:predicted permease